MNTLEEQRKYFVEYVLPSIGIIDERVLKAFQNTPREEFVPEEYRDEAYSNNPLPIGEGQTISQPSLVALMTQMLKLKGDEKVLEIGTGSGFQTAILAQIAKEVHSIERIESLSKKAKERFQRLEIKNIITYIGDGTMGLEEQAPFDAILVTAGAKEIPQPLINQLAVGGRLLIPLGDSFRNQKLTIIDKSEKGLKLNELEAVTFVPLIGEHGWKQLK